LGIGTVPDFTQPSRVRYYFEPYSHGQVKPVDLLREVRQDFGKPGKSRRWWFSHSQSSSNPKVWYLDFCFSNANDALIFALKYQR